ncbi:hypothetical protein ACLSZP_09695 [Avibacterium avium]|uniref:Capsid protein n=1 Tax=Avibacterium endocarditidis TaxID=380674 RepID=A0ABX4ZRX6_9PAST|nr:hypothetical protein [Avibacterium endocarditidis]POY42246.1 hypothetical protein C3Z13_06950 [Avibacterium endocarditidis]
MGAVIKAADYSGASLSRVPEKNLNLIIAETCRHSVLLQIVNPKYSIENLGLDQAPKAVYDIITDISVGGFTGGNWNGEVWEPNNPFKSGEITLCQNIDLEKKFSRREATRLGERWNTVQGGYETSIGQALAAEVEYYGLRSIMAHAYRYNVGTKAGRNSKNINLGSSDNPIVVGEGNTKASTVLKRMKRVLTESAGNCGLVKVVATPGFYDLVLDEQSALGAGCCLNNNPLITGITSPMLGMELYSTIAMPTFDKTGNGKRVEYVMMVNPEHIAAPMSLDFLEWQTIKRDIWLVGQFDFDVVALTGASVVVAAVVVEE